MTTEGIREAFKHLRDGEQMAGLADAARCRSESDWLIGINGTRALTKRMFGSRAGNVASVGRVQTPTLAIVYARELEIRNFKPRDLLARDGDVRDREGHLRGRLPAPEFQEGRERRARPRSTASGRRRWPKPSLAACQGQPLAAVSEEKKASTQIAPRLYDLTTLQREANSRFGFSARRTLQIAQALYERHKMITYPRTDSRALPEDYIPTVPADARQPRRRPGNARARRCSTTAGCSRTSASSTTRRSPITSPSSRPRTRPSTSTRWRRRSST